MASGVLKTKARERALTYEAMAVAEGGDPKFCVNPI